LRRRPLLVLTLRILRLRVLALSGFALLVHGSLLGPKLVHLIRRQNRIDLIAERVVGLRIFRAAGRMLRCKLIEIVLGLLHLLLGKIKAGEALHPMFVLLGTGRLLLALHLGWLLLRVDLRRCPNRQGKGRKQGGQTSDLHGLMIRSPAGRCLNAGLGVAGAYGRMATALTASEACASKRLKLSKKSVASFIAWAS
jgi:hypothetical protein